MRIKSGSEILKNINKPLKREVINYIYENNNISNGNCLLYAEFIISLLINVTDTYAGDNVVIGDVKEKHFKWCWYKVLEGNNRISIVSPDKLYNYLFSFTENVFYDNPDKNDSLKDSMFNSWLFIFDTTIPKSKKDINTFLHAYDLFEKSFKING